MNLLPIFSAQLALKERRLVPTVIQGVIGRTSCSGRGNVLLTKATPKAEDTESGA
jgi:hypothetical protein